MTDVEVTVEGGRIYIQQEEIGRNDPNSICLYPEQIDLLIGWLKEGKGKALEG